MLCCSCVRWPAWQVFHAIIGDPPYGVRAGAKKISSNKKAPIQDPATHIARTGWQCGALARLRVKCWGKKVQSVVWKTSAWSLLLYPDLDPWVGQPPKGGLAQVGMRVGSAGTQGMGWAQVGMRVSSVGTQGMGWAQVGMRVSSAGTQGMGWAQVGICLGLIELVQNKCEFVFEWNRHGSKWAMDIGSLMHKNETWSLIQQLVSSRPMPRWLGVPAHYFLVGNLPCTYNQWNTLELNHFSIPGVVCPNRINSP